MTAIIALWPTIKKYLKYAAIVLVAVAAVIVYVAFKRWTKSTPQTDDSSSGLRLVLDEVKAKLGDANRVAAIEVTAARTQEGTVKTRLSEVTKIEDPKDRRDKLLALYQEVNK